MSRIGKASWIALTSRERNIQTYLHIASMPYAGRSLRPTMAEEIKFDDWDLKRRRENAEAVALGRSPLDRGFINRVVKWEMKYIPKGDKGSLQNSLRFSYNILRRKHFVQGISRHETLKELVEKMQKLYPDFTPLYDKEIFKI